MTLSSMMHLTSAEVAELDPYAFLAVLGKRVIHPGGRRPSEEGRSASLLEGYGETLG